MHYHYRENSVYTTPTSFPEILLLKLVDGKFLKLTSDLLNNVSEFYEVYTKTSINMGLGPQDIT